ncbi:MAG: DMT family transporter [Pseudomonadota bacterium]
MRRDRIDNQGAILLVTFSLLMGGNHVMVKLTNEGIAPILQAGLRSLIALPIVLGFALIMRRRLSLRDGTFWPGMLCGLFFAIEFVLLFIALDMTDVSRAAILFYTMPVWLAVAAHFLIPGERLNLQRLAGLGLAVCGVTLALGGATGEGSLLGDLLSLLGALFWTGIALTARLTRLRDAAPEMQLIYQLGVSAVLLLLIAPMDGPLLREIEIHHWGLLVAQAIFVISIGFLLWFWVLKTYPASDMAAFGFLSPVFSVAMGWAILDEPVGPALLIALALVGAGIFLVTWKPARKRN